MVHTVTAFLLIYTMHNTPFDSCSVLSLSCGGKKETNIYKLQTVAFGKVAAFRSTEATGWSKITSIHMTFSLHDHGVARGVTVIRRLKQCKIRNKAHLLGEGDCAVFWDDASLCILRASGVES